MNKKMENANDKNKVILKGDELMIKKIAWDTFKNTGDINTFMEFKQIELIENSMNNNKNVVKNGAENNGTNKNEWDNPIGK